MSTGCTPSERLTLPRVDTGLSGTERITPQYDTWSGDEKVFANYGGYDGEEENNE